MQIVFRVDSGITIGSGHLIRCLTLANELRRCGAEIVFVSREHPGHLIAKLEEASYLVFRLPSCSTLSDLQEDYSTSCGTIIEQDALDTLEILYGRSFDWLIVDHYNIDITWERQLRSIATHILVVDDLANRKHACDILIDQNYFGSGLESRYKNLVPKNCICLLGPKYAILQPEYANLRKNLASHNGKIKNILVFFGSSDVHNHTAKVLIALQNPTLAHLKADIVVGINHPDIDGLISLVNSRPETTLHRNLDSLAFLMSNGDLFIGAGGSTTWERMALGLPAIVISIAHNQQFSTNLLSTDDFQLCLASGNLTTPNQWYEAIDRLIESPSLICKLAQNSKSLVDGWGGKRIARAIYKDNKFELKVRPACPRDETLLLEWANDPEVRSQSFQREIISVDTHKQWFNKKLSDPNCHILIGEDDQGLPIGQVRFELDNVRGIAVIGISLDKVFRGMKLSSKLLSKAISSLDLDNNSIKKFIAEVRDKNQQSQQLFTNLQFVPVPSDDKGVKIFELEVRRVYDRINWWD